MCSDTVRERGRPRARAQTAEVGRACNIRYRPPRRHHTPRTRSAVTRRTRAGQSLMSQQTLSSHSRARDRLPAPHTYRQERAQQASARTLESTLSPWLPHCHARFGPSLSLSLSLSLCSVSLSLLPPVCTDCHTCTPPSRRAVQAQAALPQLDSRPAAFHTYGGGGGGGGGPGGGASGPLASGNAQLSNSPPSTPPS